MAWKWRDCVWGTSFITTTQNEGCGMPKIKKLLRVNAPCWGKYLRTYLQIHCVRGRGQQQLLTSWSLPLQTRLLSLTPGFHCRLLFYSCLYEQAKLKLFEVMASCRHIWVITVSHWLFYCTERRELFLIFSSLHSFCSKVFRRSSQTNWKAAVCLWVYKVVCVWGECLFVCECVCVLWGGDAFVCFVCRKHLFLTRGCEDNLRSFSNQLLWGSIQIQWWVRFN